MSHQPHSVIFTDLDHTLLDGRGTPGIAGPVIRMLAKRGIPVVPTTSKTAAEVAALMRTHLVHGPAVVENGVAICLPAFNNHWRTEHLTHWRYPRIRAVLHKLAHKLGVRFSGFGDWGLDEIARLTGLTRLQALNARRREASEPIRADNPAPLLQALADHGLQGVQGGRFISVQPQGVDKGSGARALLKAMRPVWGHPRVIALGDAPNDIGLLNMADHAACLPGPHPV
ncbi:MAG: HAD-IIB family hydrolase, partial [Gammaproteobacteria bacterium]